MGFHRSSQPLALDRAAVTEVVSIMVAEEIITMGLVPEPDPFGVAHDCRNPAGHDFIASCGDVVCVHCSKVVWR